MRLPGGTESETSSRTSIGPWNFVIECGGKRAERALHAETTS